MIKRFVVFGTILLFICMSITPSLAFDNPVSSGNTLFVGGSGEGNYSRIQDAINDAVDGDTVFVYDDSSPYYGRVTLSKSINLVGEDKDTTIIDSSYRGSVVSIYSDWVNISGFTIKKSGYAMGIEIHSNLTIIAGNNIISNNNQNGIYLRESSNNNIITGNNITNNGDGIQLYYSSGNIITGNNILNNDFGIILDYTSKNIITNNNIISNLYTGIDLFYSIDNNITGNNITNNNEHAMYFYESNNNNITGNAISSNNFSVLLLYESSGNNITGNNISSQIGDYGYGMNLQFSSNNIIKGNNIILNKNGGISITDSSNNNWISGNLISNSTFGINIQGCNDNKILNNTIENNRVEGIGLNDSQNTMISGNVIRYNGEGDEFDCGIKLLAVDCRNNTVSGNIISNNNPTGIYVNYAFGNVITGNNFIDNYGSVEEPKKWWGNAYFVLPLRIKSFIGANSWRRNYWSDYSGSGVKKVNGDVYIFIVSISWYQIEWFPAQEPYDIGV